MLFKLCSKLIFQKKVHNCSLAMLILQAHRMPARHKCFPRPQAQNLRRKQHVEKKPCFFQGGTLSQYRGSDSEEERRMTFWWANSNL